MATAIYSGAGGDEGAVKLSTVGILSKLPRGFDGGDGLGRKRVTGL